MNLIKKLFKKVIDLIKWIWRECKDWRTLVIFILVWLVMMSPVIVGYILYFITKNEWHLTYSNVVLVFWFGPFTPLIPICIGITFTIKKILRIKEKHHNDKEEKKEDQ